jgi:hypothetical protein
MRVNELRSNRSAELDHRVLGSSTWPKFTREGLITLSVGVVVIVVSSAGLGFLTICLLDPTCRPFAGSFNPPGLVAMRAVGLPLAVVGFLLCRDDHSRERRGGLYSAS